MNAENIVGADLGLNTPNRARRAAENLLDFDMAEFRSRFNRLPFHVRHDLAGHPLFTLQFPNSVKSVQSRQRQPQRHHHRRKTNNISIHSRLLPVGGLLASCRRHTQIRHSSRRSSVFHEALSTSHASGLIGMPS